ncbi:hypothetical protein [Escherichia coli]|uniref:hypothetical protein n=1 Tax=Escherichia coli TaxID=562 RepID=UPI0027E45AAB|nr:hypothetical protein [Escherichia coli]
MNLKTPGREDEEIAVATTLTREERPYQIIEAVGGFDNIEDVDASRNTPAAGAGRR